MRIKLVLRNHMDHYDLTNILELGALGYRHVIGYVGDYFIVSDNPFELGVGEMEDIGDWYFDTIAGKIVEKASFVTTMGTRIEWEDK